MIYPTAQEVSDIIEEINGRIYDAIGEDVFDDWYMFELTGTSNGNSITIEFLGFQIWSSEDDERLELSEDVYEPLEIYLLGKIKEIYSAYRVLAMKI